MHPRMSGAFWRVFGTSTILILVATVVAGLATSTFVERFEFQRAEQDLRAKAFLIGEYVRDCRAGQLPHLQVDADALASEIDSRITLLDGNGKVLADSASDAKAMENHARRPEIIATGDGTAGLAVHRSQTTGAVMLYVARRVGQPASSVAFVRVATPLERIRVGLLGLERCIWGCLVCTAAGLMFLGFCCAQWVGVTVQDYPPPPKGDLAGQVSGTGDRASGDQLGAGDGHLTGPQSCVAAEFMAGLAQEIRAPLSAITACAETLHGGASDTADDRDFFTNQIVTKADHLCRLVVNALTLIRIKSGLRVFHFEEVWLDDIVPDWAVTLRARINSRNLQFEVVPPAETDSPPRLREVGEPVPTTAVAVRADEGALIEVLDHLMDNAVNATPPGGRIRIAWQGDAGQVRLEVQDTGIGIAERDLPYIFDPFFRADRSRARNLGGAGLGLSVVRELVRAMGGTVRVESRPGYGARFVVCLPPASRA